MRKRRVAILYAHALFGEGIAQLLDGDEQLQVICLDAGLAETCEKVKELRPHAIVVEGSEDGALLRDLVQNLPRALFVMVRMEDNIMDVFHGRQEVPACPENLAEVLHQGLRPRAQPSVSSN